MLQKSGINSPVEVGSIAHYLLDTSQVVGLGISEPSAVAMEDGLGLKMYFLSKNGDIPTSYASLPGGSLTCLY